ncbi:hypothetical protein [Streptomyces gobitricini]|uniref:UspA domain-containing protein n=1 Tax=Streptomyces gobitricini TaxID=68211 RepID=A0ABN3L9J8_9ACTN
MVLALDGSPFDKSVAVEGTWTAAVLAGAQAVVAVGLDPLPHAAPRATVAAYLESRWYSGRILVGATRAHA